MQDFKKDINSNTVITGDFKSPLSTVDRSSKQKNHKNIVALKHTLDQMDLIDTYIIFHPKEAKYTFLSNILGTFSKIDHIIGHKTSLNKLKRIEIRSGIFLDNNSL